VLNPFFLHQTSLFNHSANYTNCPKCHLGKEKYIKAPASQLQSFPFELKSQIKMELHASITNVIRKDVDTWV